MKDRYIDDYGTLMEIGWDGQPAMGDPLWRTAILNIITGNKYPTDDCYKDGYVYRHPLYKKLAIPGGNTCSRDQVIMDQVSRKISHQKLPKVRVFFSDKFFQTPDMWLWMRAIRGSKACAFLFHLWNSISLPWLLKRNERLWKKGKDAYFRKGARGRYPFYAFHLMSWMTHVLPESKIKLRVNCICFNYLLNVDPNNHLLWYLHGGSLRRGIAEDYVAKTDFRWQRIANRLPPGVALEEYNGPFQIDKDILSWAAGCGH